MKVTVRLGGSLAGDGGKEQVLLLTAGATVSSLLESLRIGYQGGTGKSGEAGREPSIILLNGRNIEFLNGLDTPLSDGDILAVFPTSGGG
jgi:molybdopterin converting factor small subunit